MHSWSTYQPTRLFIDNKLAVNILFAPIQIKTLYPVSSMLDNSSMSRVKEYNITLHLKSACEYSPGLIQERS